MPVFYLLLAAGFFALTLGLVRLVDALKGSEK